jgi:ribosomal-protein-alanine N-acetyltransferase
MNAADLECVVEISASLREAPHWPLASYVAAMDPENSPPRIAMVVERVPDGSDSEWTLEERTAGAEARVESAGHMPGINPWPTLRERILGFALAGVVAPEAELETIAVAPQHQRRGLGGLLLRALAGELRKEQVTDLMLEVRASNRAALAFYRGQGFAEAGRRVRYYADPEEDAVLMRLKLG